jgi:hypothetical protein
MTRVFVALILIGIATVAFSQNKAEIGLKGGVNRGTIDGVSGYNGVGAHVGAYGLYRINKFGIQPELLYSKRGDGLWELTYLDVPIMLKYYPVKGLNIQAGPQIAFRLYAERYGKYLSGVQGTEFSTAMGLGYDFSFGLNVTGRYIHGLSEIKGNNFNRTYQFSLGYRLFKVGN